MEKIVTLDEKRINLEKIAAEIEPLRKREERKTDRLVKTYRDGQKVLERLSVSKNSPKE